MERVIARVKVAAAGLTLVRAQASFVSLLSFLSCLLVMLCLTPGVPVVLDAQSVPPLSPARSQGWGTPVLLTTTDGALIHGDLYGKGPNAVVLAHGGRFTKESWAPQARTLAHAGFRVLAIDFRGYGASTGPDKDDVLSAPLHLDVLAAVRYLRETGATSVSAIGGSMGGAAAAKAAVTAPGSLDRLVLLGATPDDPPEALTLRKLYIMARDDTSGAGPRLPGLQRHLARAPEPKQVLLLNGSAHAQAIFDTADADAVMKSIVEFLTAP